MRAIPVIALTGYLGAGKTSLLNHVLQAPGARIGVVINDFGEINVDAALVTGQVDEPVSITGGCVCCLPDDGGLDDALEKLADPRLALDVIIVEASGLADPVAVSRLIRFSGVERVRPGGVVDVIDAATHFDVVDGGGAPLARYGAASLVVVNKLDQIPEADRAAAMERIETRVRERNPHAHVVGTIGARIDPTLLYDVSDADEGSGQLSFRELLLDAASPDHHAHEHVHAASVTSTSDGGVDPAALLDLLEEPPDRRLSAQGNRRGPLPRAGAELRRQRGGLVDSRRDRATDGADQLPGRHRDALRRRRHPRPGRRPRCARTTASSPPRASDVCSGTGGSASEESPESLAANGFRGRIASASQLTPQPEVVGGEDPR